MTNDLGTGRTVVILTVVIGCFGVLWPKIFFPMFHSTITTNNEVDRGMHPSMMHPRLRDVMKSTPLTPIRKETTRGVSFHKS